MRITKKEKWVIGILAVIMLLCFLIPLGSRKIGHQATVPMEITAQEETMIEPATTSPTEEETPITPETLLGEDYVQSLTETITMQMETEWTKKPTCSTIQSQTMRPSVTM